MRSLAAVLLALLVVVPVNAGVVVHEFAPGIVAWDEERVLGSDGQVWLAPQTVGEWEPDLNPRVIPPIPVSQMKFWTYQLVISIYDEYWKHDGTEWTNYGPWPEGPDSYPDCGEVRIDFVQPEPSPILIEILDTAGRKVATILKGEIGGGIHSIEWDGRDAAGNRAPAGDYLARIEEPDGVTTVPLVLAW